MLVYFYIYTYAILFDTILFYKTTEQIWTWFLQNNYSHFYPKSVVYWSCHYVTRF